MAPGGLIAVVTGAAQGLGRGFSEILLQNSVKVALLDANEAAGARVKEVFDKQFGSDKTLFLKCDVQSEEQLRVAFQKTKETFGQLDIVCNNAGIIDEKNWEKAVSVNLLGTVRGTYIALEHMNRHTGGQGGVVINVSSMAGLGPILSSPVYTATKHAVVGFTRAMAASSSVSGYGVRFNVLCPAFTQTDMLNALRSPERAGQFSHLVDAAQTLTEKFGILSVSEVAKSFLQLVTDETKNGEALMIHGKGSQYVSFPSL
ncbi:15-hydroxyprostaglandin dehydrogenase [NAD(+)] [Lampris incognitus]|uniref:15-hydroxyprostaglandin dehydrogenase [NAD(+)] n=1 Tax=Lampris incognitus TaxID=2546036 RepID=UPI0024B4DA5D|nr:15-hydroxyprostaglandin dehydrogenase [NAD(+)] [Lampris incognitus]